MIITSNRPHLVRLQCRRSMRKPSGFPLFAAVLYIGVMIGYLLCLWSMIAGGAV